MDAAKIEAGVRLILEGVGEDQMCIRDSPSAAGM